MKNIFFLVGLKQELELRYPAKGKSTNNKVLLANIIFLVLNLLLLPTTPSKNHPKE